MATTPEGLGIRSFLEGEGEMAHLMRCFDWSSTPLGMPERWPASLKAMVRMGLSTRHPVFIFWGREHICLYNDAYRASLGPEKHPAMLGSRASEMWSEIWPIIGPQIDQVLRGGGPTWHENQLVPIVRHGGLQDVYWTYSYGPIDDELALNGIGGVLVLCTETTQQVMTEQRLATERERFARLFEQAPSFMTMLRGPDHVIELANPSYIRLVGDRPVLGRKVADALPEAVEQGYLALLDSVYASGKAFSATSARFDLLTPPHGSVVERFLDFVYQPIMDSDGAVTGIFVEGVDVTERRLAEKALSVSEEQLRLATEAAEIGLWDVDLVAGKLYWPARVKAMFGISPDVPVSMDDFYAGLHPEDRQATSSAFAAAMDPVARALYDVEYRVIGKEDHALRWVAAKGRGIFDAAGQCVRVLGTAIDITPRKANEAKLIELNETLERRFAASLAERKILADVVEGTSAFIQVLGLDFRWLAINQAGADEFARNYGVRPKAGDSLLTLLAGQPQSRDALSAGWTRALAGQEFTVIEAFDDPARGRRFHEAHFNALHDANGRGLGAYQFAYDVTERILGQERLTQVETALRQAQKMEAIGQLTGGIAHDFNNLLQAVRGSLDLIRRKSDDVARVHQLVDRGIDVTRRGAKLAAQLLTFSREQSPELRPVSVQRLLAGVEDLLRATLGGAVRLSLKAPDDELSVIADSTQLEMAVLNLAINARDAMPEGGTLSIEARRRRIDGDAELPAGDFAEMRVSDTGAGMSPEIAARAFDPFFTTKSVGKGSGLGLSQVYGMAQRAGGTARIESRVGEGTTVVIVLRRSEVPESDAPPDAEEAALAAASATGRAVLVVDDDRDVRLFLAEALRTLGYRVHEAEDGPSAIGALAREPFDALVVDFAMPGMNGAELARLARQRHPELPVLIVSGFSDTAAIEQAGGSGVAVLRKPFDIAALQSAIELTMAKQKSSRAPSGFV